MCLVDSDVRLRSRLSSVSAGRPSPHLTNPMFYDNLMFYDAFPRDWTAYVIRAVDTLRTEFNDLASGKLNSFHSRSHFDWLDSHIKDSIMPRGKKRSDDSTSATPKRPSGNCSWINVRLEDTDVLELSEREPNPDDLLGWIIEMSRLGADVGIKWADEGQSRMAYCIVPDTDTGKTLVGVSAYGADAWDALVALVYKIDIKLERHFVGRNDVEKPRFR